jgi:L-threonylcarbamoyladenylate synthase
MSKYLDLQKNIDDLKIKEAAKIIKNGGLVVFPTETVYGIGANGLNTNAVEKIYIAKGRKQDNPLILHISNKEMLNLIAENITDVEAKLIEAFWPGPFTIILNRKKCVPNIVTGGLDTVGVRMPSGEIARRLIEASECPIAAPSANVSGRPSGTTVEDIFEELKDKVECIIDGGKSQVGLESTVVRVIDGVPNILRPGKITPEQIKQATGNVKIDKHIIEQTNVKENEAVLSPGMKYKHYAPNTKCILVYSDDEEKVIAKIKEISKNKSKVTIISYQENIEKYKLITNSIINLGSKENLDEISKNIFSALREVDKIMPEIAIIEGVKQEGIGLAIMNRLVRACGAKNIFFL